MTAGVTRRLCALGPVRTVDGEGNERRLRSRQAGVVLVALALTNGQPISSDGLVELLWPDGRARHQDGALRGVIAKARAFIATLDPVDLTLENIGGAYRLTGDDAAVDLWQAERALEEAERFLALEQPAEAVAPSQLAVQLLALPLLPGVDAAWLTEPRAAVSRSRARSMRAAARSMSAIGNAREAIELAEKVVLADPLDEESHRCLMEAHAARGDVEQALLAYASCRRVLTEGLGVAPSAQTDALYLRLLGSRAAPRDADDPAPSPRPSPGPAFVGRTREIAHLRDRWDRAQQGLRQLVLLRGEAGVGKTRLALESIAELRPTHALYGRCHAEQVTAFEPFIEALRRYLAQLSAEDRVATEQRWDPAVTAVVGGTAPANEIRGTHPADDDSRPAFFEAVRRAVESLAHEPTVLVLDDLHWADASTLLLLRHLARRLSNSRLLVVATYRDDPPSGELAAAMVELHRTDGCVTLPLAGFDEEAIEALLDASGVPAGSITSAALRARTGGNPYFLTEILLTATGRADLSAALTVPDGVKELVRQRMGMLSADASAVLDIAAVLGTTMPDALLERTARHDGHAGALDAVDELIDRRLLREEELDRYGYALGFEHAIVRDAVYEQLDADRRRTLHVSAAQAMRAEPDPGTDVDWASVAHHYFVADDPRHGTAMIDATINAAEHALDSMGYEQAEDLYGRAIVAMDRFAPDDARRAECFLGRGAALRRAGSFTEAHRALESALDLARLAGREVVFAEATLELVAKAGRGVAVDLPDLERAALLQEALDRLDALEPNGPHPVHAPVELLVSLLAELALALMLTGPADRRRAAAERAEKTAAASGRPDLIARAVVAHRLRRPRPDAAEVRLRHTDQLVTTPRPSGVTREQVVRLRMWRLVDAFELGDRDGVDRELRELRDAADELRQPYWLWVAGGWQALVTFLDGDPDLADAQALAALAQVEGLNHPETVLGYGLQLVVFRLLQGRGSEVVGLLEGAARDNPHISGMRCGLTYAQVQAGDREGARRNVALLAANDFATIPEDDANWSISMAGLANAVAWLDDAGTARLLLPKLEPFRDRFAVVNGYGGGGGCWGPFSEIIAALQLCVGDREGADASCASALAAAQRFRSPVMIERAAQHLAHIRGVVTSTAS